MFVKEKQTFAEELTKVLISNCQVLTSCHMQDSPTSWTGHTITEGEYTLYDTEHFWARSSMSDETRSSTVGARSQAG